MYRSVLIIIRFNNDGDNTDNPKIINIYPNISMPLNILKFKGIINIDIIIDIINI
jgi:hypothetical protein